MMQGEETAEFMAAVRSDIAYEKLRGEIFSSNFEPNLSRVYEEDRLTMTLAKSFEAQREVKTPAGYVDLVSEKLEIVAEVKSVKGWKHALGQILVYAHYFPSKRPFIVLFGGASDKKREMIKHHAERFGVCVMFISGLSDDLKSIMRLEKKYNWNKLAANTPFEQPIQSTLDFFAGE